MRVRCLDCRNHFDIKSKSDPKSFFDLAVRMGGFAVVGYFIFTQLALVIFVAFLMVLDNVASGFNSGSGGSGRSDVCCKHCGSSRIKKIDIKANKGEKNEF